MSKYVIEDTTLTAIGNAIREKGGTTATIKPGDMPTAIAELPSGGGDFTYPELVLGKTGAESGANPLRGYLLIDTSNMDMLVFKVDLIQPAFYYSGGRYHLGVYGVSDTASYGTYYPINKDDIVNEIYSDIAPQSSLTEVFTTDVSGYDKVYVAGAIAPYSTTATNYTAALRVCKITGE